MDEVHKDAITKNLVALCRDIVLEPLLTLLMEEKIFSSIDFQYIMAERTDYEKNRKICLDLKRKGPTAYNKFINALFESDQDELAERILLTEYNIRNETQFTDYNDVPREARMEAEGGCISRKKKESLKSSRGQPILQPTDDTPNNHSQPPTAENQLNIAGKQSSTGASGDHVESDRYKMESDPRGYMLIISNKMFEKMGQRVGSDKDFVQLDSVFTNIGYEVETVHNLKAQEMKNKLIDFSKQQKHRSVDSTIIAILSHGVEGAVCGTDSTETENLVYIKDIEEIFNGENCSQLLNKPKLFILQCCRGVKEDTGVWESDAPQSDEKFAEKLKRERRRLCAPTYADIIFAYATINEHKAYRNTVTGSPYVQSLCRIFGAQSSHLHVVDMLTLVTNDVAGKDMSNIGDTEPIKMLPQKTDTLRKFWYLNPK